MEARSWKNDTELAEQAGGDGMHNNVVDNKVGSLRIIYASRTHQQLKQVANEMKRSAYRDTPSIVLGSKDQLCINPIVAIKGSLVDKNCFCKKLSHATKPSGMCTYFRLSMDEIKEVERAPAKERTKLRRQALSRMKKVGAIRILDAAPRVMDIEDLYKAGKQIGFCPYFSTPEIARNNVRIIFCPYNYILDETTRNTFDVPLEDAVIVFDEAHNIESFCEEAASAFLSISDIDTINDGLRDILKIAHKIRDVVSKEDVEQILKFVLDLKNVVKEKIIDAGVDFNQTDGQQVIYGESDWVLNFIKSQEKPTGNPCIPTQLKSIRKLSTILELTYTHRVKISENFATSSGKLMDFVKRVVLPDEQEGSRTTSDVAMFRKNFNRIYRTALVKEFRGNGQREWALRLYCCSPSVVMKQLVDKKVRSIILTSGTLAPMESYPVEMGMKFPHILHNPHVIEKNQLEVIPVPYHVKSFLTKEREKKPNIIRLDSKATSRGTDYYKAIGELLVRYTSFIPGGILLFFPSYTFKTNCVKEWEAHNIMIGSHKKLFDEPRDRRTFPQILQQFKEEVDREGSSGAILIGVYRGKMSEGLDLKDNYCRTTIVIGLPYPSLGDPRIVLKKHYLSCNDMSSDFWYDLQMIRAVNQAVGRIIRHKDDYGLILLLDHRYSSLRTDGDDFHHVNVIPKLSLWLHKFVRDFDNYTPLDQKFFDNFFTKNVERLRSLGYTGKMAEIPPNFNFEVNNQVEDKADEDAFFTDDEDDMACQVASDGTPAKKMKVEESEEVIISHVIEELLTNVEFDLFRREESGEKIMFPIL